MYIFGSRITLSLATLSACRFVQLSVVSPDPFDQVPRPIRTSERMSTDTSCINEMRIL